MGIPLINGLDRLSRSLQVSLQRGLSGWSAGQVGWALGLLKQPGPPTDEQRHRGKGQKNITLSSSSTS